MIRIVLILIVFTSFNLSVKSQVNLKIVIKNLENNTGCVVMDFRDGEDEPLKAFSEKIVDKQCVISVSDLKPGNYSFRYFHDENENKKLDTYWIGVPKEGYGFSNNASGKFGPPSFEKTVFEVTNDTTMFSIPNYVKF